MAKAHEPVPSSQYFAQFPKVQFDIDKTQKYKGVPDLTVTAKFRKEALDTVKQYQPYYIPDGERPDITSFKLYGDVRYVWVIMFVNNIQNIYSDWPRSSNRLDEMMTRIYGSPATAQATIHHYEDDRGNEIDRAKYIQDTDRNRIITAFDFEVDENEQKREIILPQAAYLPTLLSDLSQIFQPTS